MTTRPGDLRICYRRTKKPNGRRLFIKAVDSPVEARVILDLLAQYDQVVIGSARTVQMLQVFDGVRWIPWRDEDGQLINDLEIEVS